MVCLRSVYVLCCLCGRVIYVCGGGDQLLLDVSSVLGSGDDNKAKHSDE